MKWQCDVVIFIFRCQKKNGQTLFLPYFQTKPFTKKP
jgi:hypothetical protein